MAEQRPSVRLTDVRHMHICGSKETYCGHPRQGGIFNFGGGELAVAHRHAPSAYEQPDDVGHGYVGCDRWAKVLLQRSTDGGETWPVSNDSVIFDETDDLDTRRAFLARGSIDPGQRDQIDLAAEDSVIHFGRTWAGREEADGAPAPVPFTLRSADKGRTWESAPTILAPPAGREFVHVDNSPMVTFPDGTLLTAAAVGWPEAVAVYGSDDNGLSWEFVAEAVRQEPPLAPSTKAGPSYAGLALLPGGRLLCTSVDVSSLRNAVQLCHSDDGGYTWSRPRPIVSWGRSPWAARRRAMSDRWRNSFTFTAPDGSTARARWDDGRADPKNVWPITAGDEAFIYPSQKLYRSAWPTVLSDGRVLVTFARRKAPFGIGGIVSVDEGATWSDEFIIRDDASGPDLGYQVATELDDGSIFCAYYYMVDDGNNFGGSRHIAGSIFGVET